MNEPDPPNIDEVAVPVRVTVSPNTEFVDTTPINPLPASSPLTELDEIEERVGDSNRSLLPNPAINRRHSPLFYPEISPLTEDEDSDIENIPIDANLQDHQPSSVLQARTKPANSQSQPIPRPPVVEKISKAQSRSSILVKVPDTDLRRSSLKRTVQHSESDEDHLGNRRAIMDRQDIQETLGAWRSDRDEQKAWMRNLRLPQTQKFSNLNRDSMTPAKQVPPGMPPRHPLYTSSTTTRHEPTQDAIRQTANARHVGREASEKAKLPFPAHKHSIDTSASDFRKTSSHVPAKPFTSSLSPSTTSASRLKDDYYRRRNNTMAKPSATKKRKLFARDASSSSYYPSDSESVATDCTSGRSQAKRLVPTRRSSPNSYLTHERGSAIMNRARPHARKRQRQGGRPAHSLSPSPDKGCPPPPTVHANPLDHHTPIVRLAGQRPSVTHSVRTAAAVRPALPADRPGLPPPAVITQTQPPPAVQAGAPVTYTDSSPEPEDTDTPQQCLSLLTNLHTEYKARFNKLQHFVHDVLRVPGLKRNETPSHATSEALRGVLSKDPKLDITFPINGELWDKIESYKRDVTAWEGGMDRVAAVRRSLMYQQALKQIETKMSECRARIENGE